MIDLRALGRDYGIPVIDSGHHHCSTGWIQTHCPFCSPGSGYHLGYNLQKGNWSCWRCGPHKTWDVLTAMLGGTAAAALAWRKYRGEPERVLHTKKPRRRTVWTPPGMRPLGRRHLRYLRGRWFDPDKLVKEWDLTGTEHLSGPKWNWRITFPIRTQDGRVVAYGGRAIVDGRKPKYRLPSDAQIAASPQSLLYGIDRVKGDSIVVVEGPSDVWRLGAGSVALLGVGWTEEQAVQIKRFRRRFIMMDPDSAGRRRGEELADWLGMFSGETEIIEGLSSDPGGLLQREADRIMEELIHG